MLNKRTRGQLGNDLPAETTPSNGRTGPDSIEAISISTSTSAVSSNGTISASERGKDSSLRGKGRDDGSGDGAGDFVGDAADAGIEEDESTDLDDDR